MHHHAGLLVDNDQVLIFVNNVDWNILGNKRFRRRRCQLNLDFIRWSNSVRGFGSLSINQDIGIFDQPMQARATPTFHSRRQKRVQVDAARQNS